MGTLAIGVDIGGTKIHTAVVNEQGGIVEQVIVPTEAGQGASAVMSRVLDGIQSMVEILKESGRIGDVQGIGIGSAGQIDFVSGTVAFAVDTLPGWTGTRIRELVQHRFAFPAFVDNDVNVIAIAEKSFGAARSYDSFICVALGTGVGGAVVESGQLVRGAFGGAGELGHVSIDFNGPRCSCGNYGCLELYASGTGIARIAKQMIERHEWKPDWKPGSREVIAAWQQGDAYAGQVMSTVIRALSTGLSGFIHTFNPQAIIVGGGVSEAGQRFFDELINETAIRTSAAMWKAVRILPAYVGAHSGVIGAAAQVWHYADAFTSEQHAP